MPDITMCVNAHCPLRQGCYRYRAVPNPYRQSFAVYAGGAACESFWATDRVPTPLREIRDADGENLAILDRISPPTKRPSP